MSISITSLLTIFKKPESVIRHMSKKNAGVAAILNFILPGLGYIYARVRGTIFPWGLFLLSIWVAVHDWNEITAILSGQMAITEHFLLFMKRRKCSVIAICPDSIAVISFQSCTATHMLNRNSPHGNI